MGTNLQDYLQVWNEAVGNLICTGMPAHVAIDKIHRGYGANSSIKKIINKLKHDKKYGTLHPSLRII